MNKHQNCFANISGTKTWIFMKFYKVVNYYLVSLSLKFHKDSCINPRARAVEWHHKAEHVTGLPVVPLLLPLELQPVLSGQVLLHGVVRPLDQHVVNARPHQNICRGRGHPEGVNTPPTVRFVPIEIDIAPLMTCIRMIRMVRMVSRMVTLPYTSCSSSGS